MVGSIDPRCETVRGTHWPNKVAWLFGARVAETILASGPKSPHQQAGHMDASDPIKPSKKLLWHGGRPHMAHRHSPLERSAGRRVSPHRLSRSCKRRADGRIDRSEVRDSPWDPLAEEGRVVVWSSRRGNHLGQRSKVTASTGRTYGRKRSDQTVEKTLVARGPSTYGSRRSPGRLGALQSADLIDRPDQVLDFLGVRAELLGELVEIGVCHSR